MSNLTLSQLLEEYQELPEFMGIPLQSVNTRGGFDSTPLHIAVHREKPDEVQLLLSSGANPNTPGEYGERPIQIAIYHDRLDIVLILLAAGASLDLTDVQGSNAWDTARIFGHADELRRLADQCKPIN